MKSTLRESGLNRIRNNGTMRTHSLTHTLRRRVAGALMLGALLFLCPFGSADAAAPSLQTQQ